MVSSGSRRAALGFRLHTGWAAAVVLGGSHVTRRVLARRRFTLVENNEHDTVFVYHAAAELDAVAAGRHLALARANADQRARAELRNLLSELTQEGYSISVVGLPVSAARPPQPLSAILRSHPLIHAAEVELFRGALGEACELHGIRVVRVLSKDLNGAASRSAGVPPKDLDRLLLEMGRSLGPPWARDQKDAALAALAASGEPSARKGRRANL